MVFSSVAINAEEVVDETVTTEENAITEQVEPQVDPIAILDFHIKNIFY